MLCCLSTALPKEATRAVACHWVAVRADVPVRPLLVWRAWIVMAALVLTARAPPPVTVSGLPLAAQRAAGFGIGIATVHRYIREAVDILAALAPTLAAGMTAARTKAFVILDGTLLPIDRIAADTPYCSGIHKHHGMNVQLLTDPFGRLPWASPALPGSTHDLAAAATTGSSTRSPPRGSTAGQTRHIRAPATRSASRSGPPPQRWKRRHNTTHAKINQLPQREDSLEGHADSSTVTQEGTHPPQGSGSCDSPTRKAAPCDQDSKVISLAGGLPGELTRPSPSCAIAPSRTCVSRARDHRSVAASTATNMQA